MGGEKTKGAGLAAGFARRRSEVPWGTRTSLGVTTR